ncbi:MAG TPA: antitoxin VapB family protein [Verrucomicrobiales bacterium]|nr:antitoxin VapB family protein [Verrucomicrobiales bacterium]
MATKTITLELDAYEKLRRAKKPGESFSQVVRRAAFPDEPLTGARLRAYLRAGGSGISETYLDSVEKALQHDPVPDDPWA